MLASGPTATDFTDITGNIFESDIRWLAAAGITKGCNPPDNTLYCPDDAVTRGQMAAFMRRALEAYLLADDATAGFTDDDSSVFEADIEWLAAAGITKGCNPPDNTLYCPDDAVTRGQMAAFMRRAMAELVPSSSPDDGSQGAGTAKDFSTEAGGSASNVGVPPPGGSGSGVPAAPVGDGPPSANAGSAPTGWSADPAAEAPPGPLANPEDVRLASDPAALPALFAIGSQEADLQLQYCLDPYFAVWGFNCPSQPVFSHNSGWLLYHNLPYHVGQIAPVGCTGTLIGRNVVLTAAHCVSDQASFTFIPDLYGGMGVGTYAQVGNSGNVWTGTRRIYHAEFLERDHRFSMFDYALVVLNANDSGQHAGDVYGWTSVYSLGAASTTIPTGYYNWNAERHMYGYPQEGWWAGLGTGPYKNQNYDAVPWWCGSNQGQYYNFGNGYYVMGFGCQTNGGNSGGPIYQRIDGELRLVSVLSTGGFAVHCEYYGVTGCGIRPDFGTSYYMMNAWGSPLLNTTGAYGYDDLLWVVYNTTLSGPVCTGPCP